MDKLKYIVNILIVALLLGSIAVGKDGRLLGEPANELLSTKNNSVDAESKEKADIEIEKALSDGTIVINTTSLSKNIIGYAGTTPIELYVKDGVVTKIEFLDNDETPSFFESVTSGKFPNSWNGMTLEEAKTAKVDAVSQATYSSTAVIKNVQSAAAYALSVEAPVYNPLVDFNLKTIIGILVILSGVFLTFYKPKKKFITLIQLALNVGVLGFWCGSFLSLTQFVAWMSNGFNLGATILTILLLAVVIIMPFFGKKGSYCHIHCPMGAVQELAGAIPIKKLKINRNVASFLNKLRYYILILLLFLMWIGIGFKLMDYEVFSAFLVSSASTVVAIMAKVFLVLSLFITRPYCRFVCPTGALLTMMQKTKDN